MMNGLPSLKEIRKRQASARRAAFWAPAFLAALERGAARRKARLAKDRARAA